VAKAVGLKEGDRVLLRVMDGSVVVEPLMDSLELGLHGDKYATIDPERSRVSASANRKPVLKVILDTPPVFYSLS